jgi:hypothetical protein
MCCPTSNPSDKRPDNPLGLSGLRQAVYILECLEKGETEEQIVERFEGDEQLVKMWTLFLFHNRWIEHPDGRWETTGKGREWISRYKQ